MWGHKIRERNSKTLGNEVLLCHDCFFQGKINYSQSNHSCTFYVSLTHRYLENYSYLQVFVIITEASFLVPNENPLHFLFPVHNLIYAHLRFCVSETKPYQVCLSVPDFQLKNKNFEWTYASGSIALIAPEDSTSCHPFKLSKLLVCTRAELCQILTFVNK